MEYMGCICPKTSGAADVSKLALILQSQHRTGCLTFFVFMMQWRLRLLYILTLSERTNSLVFHSCSHLCSLAGAPAVSGWSEREGEQKVNDRYWWKQIHLGRKLAPFFLGMLWNAQYLQMILFTDHKLFIQYICVIILCVFGSCVNN